MFLFFIHALVYTFHQQNKLEKFNVFFFSRIEKIVKMQRNSFKSVFRAEINNSSKIQILEPTKE
jgi:hypothetical protein